MAELPLLPAATATAQAAFALGGVATEAVRCSYRNAVLLLITQTGSVGTVVQARQDVSLEGKSTFTTSVLMGRRDEPLLQLAARQAIERLANGSAPESSSSGSSRQLVLCLALKQHTPQLIRQLLDQLQLLGLLQP